MTTQMQTVVGQLEVVQRQRRGYAPNVRAVEPGEAKGNLYLLLELSGPAEGRLRLYRQIMGDVQTAYYETTGNVADVLHAAVSRAHIILSEANVNRQGNQRWRGGISCLALWEDHLYLAQAGPALVMVTHPTTVEMFPSYSEPVSVALGDAEAPMIDLYHTRVEPDNTVLVLETPWLQVTDLETLAGAATAPDIATALDYLAEIAGDAHLSALALTITQLPQPSRATSTATPAANPASAAGASGKQNVPATPPTPPKKQAPPSEPAWEEDESWWEDADTEEDDEDDFAPVTSRNSKQSKTTKNNQAKTTRQTSGEGQSFLKRLMPDRRAPNAPAARKSVQKAAPAPRQPRTKPTSPPPSRSRLPLILALVIIPLIVIIVVAAMYWLRARDREDRFSSYITEAQAVLTAVPNLDETAARARLNSAAQRIDEALALKPGDTKALGVKAEIKKELDRVNRVVPLYVLTLLKEFGGGGRDLARVLVDGSDIYVLDKGRDTVERFRLNQLGDGLQPNEGGVLIQRGQTINSFVVGELVDMAWVAPVGARTASALFIVDTNGVLYEFRAPWELQGRVAASREMWQRPLLASTYSGNLYLLDAGLQQILKYQPGTNLAYASPPEQYFPPQTPIDMASALDFAIDGNIWVLSANGTIQKYLSGKQESFAFQGLPTPFEKPVSLFAGIDQLADTNNLYVADGNGSLTQFDKTGKFTRQFREADGQKLQGLRSVFVDEASARFFLLTGGALYRADIPR